MSKFDFLYYSNNCLANQDTALASLGADRCITPILTVKLSPMAKAPIENVARTSVEAQIENAAQMPNAKHHRCKVLRIRHLPMTEV